MDRRTEIYPPRNKNIRGILLETNSTYFETYISKLTSVDFSVYRIRTT